MNTCLLPVESQLAAFVDIFREVRAERLIPVDELRHFLPPADHPGYRWALGELLRVEQEAGGEALEAFRAAFPEIDDDLAVSVTPSSEEEADLPPVTHLLKDSFPSGQIIHRTVNLVRDLDADDPATAEQLARASMELLLPGSKFDQFDLVALLGTGAFGRVFLATQGDLAQREVVLKISVDLSGEPQTLARLQHTNIVPIYSVHHTYPFQAICMPYLGSVTLADLLTDLRAGIPESGRELVSTLITRCARRTVKDHPAGIPQLQSSQSLNRDASSAILRLLEKSTFVDAVLWIGARLAEGVHHAHERGVLHRDLKPANVLLTDDGQPMLLDFNVAQDDQDTSSRKAYIGGTLPYMAPEQIQAFLSSHTSAEAQLVAALRRPTPGMTYIPTTIDARSDVYALGLILYELLTGEHPFPTTLGSIEQLMLDQWCQRQEGAPSPRRRNPAVSPAVDAIIRRCLEPDPARRYQSAAQLSEDIETHLKHQPLIHTREPSLRERFLKWRRRHPHLASSTAVGIVAAAFVIILSTALWFGYERLADREALDRFAAFQAAKPEAEVLICVRSPEYSFRPQGIAQAHELLDRYGVLQNAAWLEEPNVQRLPPAEQEQLRGDVAELLVLLAGATEDTTAKESERLREEARRLRESASAVRGARELFLEASDLAADEQFDEATRLARLATDRDPEFFPAWMLLGHSLAARGHHPEAEGAYGTAIALQSSFPWAYFCRALVRSQLGHLEQAERDFTQAITLRPEMVEAYMNRALVRQHRKDYEGAIADLNEALERGAPFTRIYFMRATVYELMDKPEEAERDRQRGLEQTPTDEASWVARANARMAIDPEAALADLEEALRLNPRYFHAMQTRSHVLAERLGRIPEAIDSLDETLQHYPDSLQAIAGRGVLHARQNDRDLALQDAQRCLLLQPEPEQLYQMACIYALTSRTSPEDRTEAYRWLAAAFGEGFGLNFALTDPDLEPIHEDVEFRRIFSAAQFLAAQRK